MVPIPPDPSEMMQLFVIGVRGKTVVVHIHKDATVDDLLTKLSKENGIPASTMRIIYTTKELEYGRNKRLYEYGISNDANLFVTLRLLGGTSVLPPIPPPQKELDDAVELTDEPDMITWDDDPLGQRAKMPCGHAIGPESLTAYCRSLLSAGKFQFLCPYKDPTSNATCGKEWSYIDVRRLAVLTKEEKKEFEKKITENYLKKARGIQECPRCDSVCMRADKKDKRVVCPLCTNEVGYSYDFCWYCLHEWKTRGVELCGNAECSGEDHRLAILRNCPRKTVVGVENCPSRRACITCGLLIEHERFCKHMVCPCGQRFCFICLKPYKDGSYQCGAFNAKCEVAAVQTSIPGSE